jgi:aminopeptidase
VNLAPGQDVAIDAHVEHAPLARAVAEAAYAAGARYVDVWYWDAHHKRARVERAPEDSLSWTPPWLDERIQRVGEVGGALVSIRGDPEPDLLARVDERRAGLDMTPKIAATGREQRTGRMPWVIVACPSPGWAEAVYGEPDVERLWQEVAHFVRLDEPEPLTAWRDHIDHLAARAAGLDQRAFDALRFRGPGTDLTVGLLPGALWCTAAERTLSGRANVVNLPTEEVFTTPDPQRTEGTARATRPMALSGSVVRGLELRFHDGRCVELRADTGADIVRAEMAVDPGASRLGEVALVDGSTRIGRTGRTYLSTLLDENAGSHIAYGHGIGQAFSPDWGPGEEEMAAAGGNSSARHTDIVIGSAEVEVDGLDESGRATAIVRDGEWRL